MRFVYAPTWAKAREKIARLPRLSRYLRLIMVAPYLSSEWAEFMREAIWMDALASTMTVLIAVASTGEKIGGCQTFGELDDKASQKKARELLLSMHW